MRKFGGEITESFKDKLLAYINNRCFKKPTRNKPWNIKYTNRGIPVGSGHIMGLGKNYAVIFSPKRRKLKGWQR